MKATIKEVVLASYLHDVGKFAQRAGIQEFYDKNFESDCCKHQNGGWYSHQHAVYTEGFLNKYKNVLPKDVNSLKVKELASRHHNPSNFEQWLISVADCLSSGSDRCNVLSILKPEDEYLYNEEKLKFYEKPMIHLISTLAPDGQNAQTQAYYKMTALEEDSVLSSSNKKIGKEDYKKLWEQFEKDFQDLADLDFEQFIKSFETLAERYWWCIPSATNSDADISLFQHAKTTAAFAACLYRFHENSENEPELRNYETNKFLFVNGDISGIQKYIFDLKTSSDSAKMLRSKSFQLWAISQILAEFICKKFGVFECNIITSAGGKFLVMVPNTLTAKSTLDEIQCAVETYFLKEFAGKLAVIISDGVEANGRDLQKKNISELFRKIGYAADCSKQKKMQKALKKNGALLNEFYESLQQNGECPKCGLFPKNPKNEDEECDSCKKLTEIGAKLVKGSCIKLDSNELKHFGQMIHVYRNDEMQGKDLYSINEYKPGMSLMFLPYTAPFYDKEESKLKSFEEIAQSSNGTKKLAMFKSDIDNLGLVFNSYLGDRISISRYADLSFMLHYFFSAFYTWFVQNKQNPDGIYYSDVIYTVFSGGDDLCVVGAWDSIIYFARDFQKALCEFTNNNPHVTISGGISLCSPKLPVNVIAEMAEENLELSKGYSNSSGKLKNAITVFGTTVNWNDYENILRNDAEWLDSCLNNNQLSQGVVYKMIDFSNRAKAISEGKITSRNLLWKSNFAYMVSRNVKDSGFKKKMLDFAADDKKMIESKIAVSYALYKNRDKNIEEE